MNLSCDTVLDLVSIYKDGASSEATVKAVDEHLKTCPDCRRYYRQYDSINRLLTRKTESPAPGSEERYADFTAALRRRHTIETLAVYASAAVAVAAVGYAVFGRRR